MTAILSALSAARHAYRTERTMRALYQPWIRREPLLSSTITLAVGGLFAIATAVLQWMKWLT